jgi:hypothetical protein
MAPSIYHKRLTRNEQTGGWQREIHVESRINVFACTIPQLLYYRLPAPSAFGLLHPDGTLSSTNDRAIMITHKELAELLSDAERGEVTAEAPFSPSSSEMNIPFTSRRKRVPAKSRLNSH